MAHGDGCHTIPFRDLEALVTFQMDMERVLLATNWLLEDFSPDRRRYADRRAFPRIENDRRRWWTDVRTSVASAFGRRRRG